MKTIAILLAASALCVTAIPASATPDEKVRGIISAWAQAYTDGDHIKIAQSYDRFARLHGVDAADLLGPETISEHFYFANWHNKLQSVKLDEYKCYSYDDATATCAGGMEFLVTKRSGETLKQPTQFSVSLAYDYGDNKWLIHDHRVLRGTAVVVNPATALQADAVKQPPIIVPASTATTPIQ